MRPEVRQLDETVPDQEGCRRVQSLRDLRRAGALVVSELEAEDLCDDVAALLAFETDVDGWLLPLLLFRPVDFSLDTRSPVRRPWRSREDVDKDLPVLDGVVGKGIEENVEGPTGVEVEVACRATGISDGSTEAVPQSAPMRVFILSLTLFALRARSASVSCGEAVRVECAGPRLARTSTSSFEYPSLSSRRRLNFCCR